MRKIIEDFWREEHLQGGYGFVTIPHIMRSRLWEISGPPGFLFKDSMYSVPWMSMGSGLLAQAHELPLPHHDLQDQRCAPTASLPAALG